jgi:hypothetical protein
MAEPHGAMNVMDLEVVVGTYEELLLGYRVVQVDKVYNIYIALDSWSEYVYTH